MFLKEGGAGGHMQHPFDLPSVKTGQDLKDFFDQAAEVVRKSQAVKIDGVNVSFKLITDEKGRKEFAVDRGSTKPIDIEGISMDRVGERFPEGHGMRPAIKTLLSIFNEALPKIEPELKKLGMWDNPTIFLNTEYVSETTNVTEYDHSFLAIHGVNQFYEKTNSRTGVQRPGLSRPEGSKDPSVEVSYEPEVLQKLADKVQPFAKKYDFEVYTTIPTSFKDEAAIDYAETLKEPFTVVFSEDDQLTKPLGEWLKILENPRHLFIKKPDGKKIGALSKEVYTTILNGTPLTSFIQDEKDVKSAIAGAVFYHATRMLGNDILRALTSPMGDVTDHEGVVIRHKKFGIKPVKITGEFILGGMSTGFRENLIREQQDKYVVLIPGGFKPPHKGHYAMIQNYANMPNVESVVILSGDKPREGITKDMSQKLFDLYGGLSDKVKFVDDNLPLRAAFEKLGEKSFVNQFGDNVIFTMGCSDKPGDEKRSEAFAAWFENNPDENILDVKVESLGACPSQKFEGEDLSASAMRKALRDGDDKTVQFHIPDGVDIEEVKEILATTFSPLEEMILTLVEETLNEIYVSRSCKKKDGSSGNCHVTFKDGHTACYDNCKTARAATHGGVSEGEELEEITLGYELPSREKKKTPTPSEMSAASKARMIRSYNKAVEKQKEKDRLSLKFNKKALEEELEELRVGGGGSGASASAGPPVANCKQCCKQCTCPPKKGSSKSKKRNTFDPIEEISSGAGGAAGGYSLPLGMKPTYPDDSHPHLRGSIPGIKLIYKRKEK